VAKAIPEFKIVLGNDELMVFKELVYRITHDVQNKINKLIDTIKINSATPASHFKEESICSIPT